MEGNGDVQPHLLFEVEQMKNYWKMKEGEDPVDLMMSLG